MSVRAVTAPVAPAWPQGGGRQRTSDRAVLAAILYLTAADRSWRTLPPDCSGSAGAVHRRLQEWRWTGGFDRLRRAVSDHLASDEPTVGRNW